MASIYIESLSKEYQRKLRERKLELQTIESLAASISKKHLQKKRALKKEIGRAPRLNSSH